MPTPPAVLIANRGEVAVRIIRAVADLGWRSVAVTAADEVDARHAALADDAVHLDRLGPPAYLDVDAMVAAATSRRCGLLHPGYGFLSERAELAEGCAAAGVTFVGPAAETLALLGDKVAARRLARRLDVPVLAATDGATDLAGAQAFFDGLGPDAAVMVKAVAGGGGRGMRPVFGRGELDQALERCASEASGAFGSGDVYVEALLPRARHVEVQVLGDGTGAVTQLGDRDCSVQRHRQKLIEVAPAPDLDQGVRAALTAAAVRMAAELRYRGVGTFEFLVDLDDPGRWTFMEANPRLQVEHPVTEAVHGVDLVRAQLLVAAGRTLDDLGLRQGDIRAADGTAIEARITAESSGTVEAFDAPSGPGVRVDTALHRGAQVGPRYDSLLVKVVGHVPGGDVRDAARRTARAVAECVIAGIDTNADLLQGVLTHPEFLAGPVDTGFVERHLSEWMGKADEVNPTTAEMSDGDGAVVIGAPLTATVLSVLVEAGQAVSSGQPVAVLESMKMEHLVRAPRHGIVQSVTAAVEDTVAAGDPLLSLLPSDAAPETGEATAATPPTERREYADFVARRHRTTDEGRPDAVARRHAAGRRTARQNVADLCDPDSFVEYGTFAIAAQRRRRELADLIERTPGDGMVSGLARINGGQAAVVSYDYTVLAGTQGLRNHRKTDRLFDLADRLRLPVVLFAEGGGGRPGDTDSGGFAGLDVPTFGTFARLSGQVPLVGVVSGYCFAGNAALLGCCDVIIATPDANIGMGGPAMIEGGGLGVHRPQDVGPVAVQVPNGVIDILAPDEPAAVATARRYLSYFQGPSREWSAAGQEALRTVVPENRRRVYDTRDAITLVADEGSVLELRPEFGVGMVTALARLEGRPVGIIANDPRHLGGAIDAAGADKAARFLQLCDAHGLAVVTFCDTPGFMVGPESERSAQVRHFSRMFVAGAALRVPLLSVILRKGYGLGAMAMCGGSFKAPLSTVSWPTGEFGGMGLEGAVRLGFAKELEAIADPDEQRAAFEHMVDSAYEQGKAMSAATYFEFDEVIDPAGTRQHLVDVLAAAPPRPPRPPRPPGDGAADGRGRFVDTW